MFPAERFRDPGRRAILDGEAMSLQPHHPSTLDRPSRPKDADRTTRRPLPMWDRVKFVVLFVLLWLVMVAVVWTDLEALAPSVHDVVVKALQSYGWLLALAGLEVIRQLHYVLEEHSQGYYRFWQHTVFGGFHRRTARMNDWTRYRIGRALKYVFFLAILSAILGTLFHTSRLTALIEVPGRLVAAAPFILQLAFGFSFVILQFVGLFWFLSRGGVDVYMPDDIDTRFTDVKGQDKVLDRVKETMIFLEAPESIEERGGYVPGGVLLWGPPGTGKTLMAQAMAGETARPFVFVEPGAFIQMFMGVGILKVKGLYRKLRKLALRYGGVIVFFDEADSLGNRGQGSQGGPSTSLGEEAWGSGHACNGTAYLGPRAAQELFRFQSRPSSITEAAPRFFVGGMGGGGGMGTLQSLLSEMSGLKKPRGLVNRIRRLLGMKPLPPPKYRILHMFATNRPQDLDEAMLRPGRIDRQYKVGYPHKDGRKATFDYYFAKVEHELSEEQVDKLSMITPYFTGAMIQDIVNESLVIAIREGRDSVTFEDVTRAKQQKQLGIPDDWEYIDRERHAVAVHEAAHAVVAYHNWRHVDIDIATIERRGDIGGMVSPVQPEELFTEWRSEREGEVRVLIASLAGERLFYEGDSSSGVGGDLRNATGITMMALGFAGMGRTIASHAATLGAIRGGQPVETGEDRNFDTEFHKEVEAKLQELLQETTALLVEHRADVLAVAHALETRKTVSGDDVKAVIEGTRGPLVDGRPYRDPVFIRDLERYHEAALAAHKAHGEVRSDMPTPVPPPPVPVAAVAPVFNPNGDAHPNGEAARKPGAP
jgi:cell division protease FtsH